MDTKRTVQEAIGSRREQLIGLSHAIHARPELAFEEHYACELCVDLLTGAGFEVMRNAANLPTAFVATYGSGSLNIGFCAEYDALPDIGHACGHNIIAASSVGAALGLKDLVDELDLTLTVLGTPAEEAGGGKILMLERGAFDGLHASMLVHPFTMTVSINKCLAVANLVVEYVGKAAHASSGPHLGINAADALTVAQVAIGLMRQQLPPGAQVHGLTRSVEGAPNVIPGRSTAEYLVRALDLETLEDVREGLIRCLEAGAIATGCELKCEPTEPAYSDFRNDIELASLFQANGELLGHTFHDVSQEKPAASTDMANVSRAMPTIHPSLAIETDGAAPHQEGFTAAAIGRSADDAITESATMMAWTVVDIATNPSIRERLLSSGPYGAGRRS